MKTVGGPVVRLWKTLKSLCKMGRIEMIANNYSAFITMFSVLPT